MTTIGRSMGLKKYIQCKYIVGVWKQLLLSANIFGALKMESERNPDVNKEKGLNED